LEPDGGEERFYQPYLLKTLGHQSNALSVRLQALYLRLTILSTALVFIPLATGSIDGC
jgi:hypothetical protein